MHLFRFIDQIGSYLQIFPIEQNKNKSLKQRYNMNIQQPERG